MAELIKRTKKDGKTAYLARVYCGRDKDRKPICKTKTLTPPPGMTGRKLDKELQRQADEFEQAVLRGTLQSDMLFDALLDKYFSEYKERQSTAVIIPGLWTAFLFALGNFAFLFGRGTLGYDRMG